MRNTFLFYTEEEILFNYSFVLNRSLLYLCCKINDELA